MRIYISNLSQYNQGRLVGEWVSLPCTEEELDDALSRILCLDEEYFMTDTEDAKFSVSKHDDVYKINSQVESYDALEGHERASVSFLLSEGYDFNYAIENHEDVINYPEQRLKDVAYSLVEEGCFGEVPESLSHYIDYEAIARDLSIDGYTEMTEGVFYYAK